MRARGEAMTVDGSRRWTRRARRALVAPVGLGLVLAAGALSLGDESSAALSDAATLSLGTGSDGSGVGFPYRFDVGVVRPDGTVEQASGPDGYDWVVEGAQELVPGHEVTTTIPVFNNTPTLGAHVTFEVVLRGGDGQVADGVPNISELLRFTAEDPQGALLFSDVPWAEAAASLGVLTARGEDALSQGEAYVAGAEGSATQVTLTIRYPDEPGVEDYNGGQSALALRFHATSVVP